MAEESKFSKFALELQRERLTEAARHLQEATTNTYRPDEFGRLVAYTVLATQCLIDACGHMVETLGGIVAVLEPADESDRDGVANG